MRKICAITTVFILLFTKSIIVAANSGPVYWPVHPSSEMMAIVESSPIIVEREELIFDFSNSNHLFHSLSGQVTATYEMVNPTNETHHVQMAFPFVGRLDALTAEDIVIRADGNELPYEMFVGEIVSMDDKESSFPFIEIVQAISAEKYQAKSFAENEIGTLYEITLSPKEEQISTFTVHFNFDRDQTNILTKGFQSYGYQNGQTTITASCFEPTTLEIFVIGEDVDFSYINGKSMDYDVHTHDKVVEEYLLDYLESFDELQTDMLSELQIYNLFAKSFDQASARNGGYISEYELLDQASLDRIISLVYSVEFQANSHKQVSVQYHAQGTMDKTETVEPLYTFEYILNPASNWASFGQLFIKIVPPVQAPFIVKNNFELTKVDNHYEVTYDTLPEEDLSFTFYAEEEMKAAEEGKQSFVIPAIILVILLVFFLRYRSRQK